MIPLAILGALVLGPLFALSTESQIIKQRRRRAMAKSALEQEKKREDVAETLLKGH